MAHTDACKIQAAQFTKKLMEKGLSLNAACEITEKESDGIPASTIKRWWYETSKETDRQFKNEPVDQKAAINGYDNEIQGNQEIKTQHGGAREGAGRRPGAKIYQVSDAMNIASMVICQLERIGVDDPLRETALDEVENWINKNRTRKEKGHE